MSGLREKFLLGFAHIHRRAESPGEAATPATDAAPPRAGPPPAPEGSGQRRDPPADWRPHALRCSPSPRSGISPRCSVSPRLRRFTIRRRQFKATRRAGFQRPSLDQRIRPPPECGNMNVDPIFPPIERAGVIAEFCLLLRNQGIRQLLDVLRGEVMFVQQYEWLEELNEFFQSFQVALRFHQWRLLQWQGSHDSLDRLHDRFLRRRRHAFIPCLRNRYRIKPQPQPGFQPLLRAVVLAVSERSQLNRAPHVAWIGYRGCQLI